MQARINLTNGDPKDLQLYKESLDEILGLADEIQPLYGQQPPASQAQEAQISGHATLDDDILLKKRDRLKSLNVVAETQPVDDHLIYEASSDEEVYISPEEIAEIRKSRKSNPLFQGCNSIENYLYIKRISEGAYGVVFKAKEILSGEIYAVKNIKLEGGNCGFPVSSLREISTLMGLNHTNVIKIKEVVTGDQKDKIYVVLEYMDYDLKTMLYNIDKTQLTPAHIKCLMRQLLEGVAYLHSKFIIHRDLKTSNLLVNKKGELKVCDFGLARDFSSPGRPYSANVVTLWYRAPELLLPQLATEYNELIDIWSVGCIMAEIILGAPLFKGESELEQIDLIFKTLGVPSDNVWPGVSQLIKSKQIGAVYSKPTHSKLKEVFTEVNTRGTNGPLISYQGFQLLSSMLEYNPKSRITAKRALQHAWFKEEPQECQLSQLIQPRKQLRPVKALKASNQNITG